MNVFPVSAEVTQIPGKSPVWFGFEDGVDINEAFISSISDYLLFINEKEGVPLHRIEIDDFSLCDITAGKLLYRPIPNFILEQHGLHSFGKKEPNSPVYRRHPGTIPLRRDMKQKALPRCYNIAPDGSVQIRTLSETVLARSPGRLPVYFHIA